MSYRPLQSLGPEQRPDRPATTVNDIKTGKAFELPVRNGECAHDVFHHPYAHAATRRNGTASRSPLSPAAARPTPPASC